MRERSGSTVADGSGGWVISLAMPLERELVAAVLRAAGVEARPRRAHETLEESCDGASGLVLEGVYSLGANVATLTRQLRSERPGLDVVVALQPRDVHGAWSCMRAGATPWTRASDGSLLAAEQATAALVDLVERHVRGGFAAAPHAVRRTIDDALDLALANDPRRAIAELCSIAPGAATATALQVLTDTCAALLRRLRGRSRYPVPLRYVADRLQVSGDDDVQLCLRFLYDASFRNAGVVIDSSDLFPAESERDRLYGAFEATIALLRFAAARSWTTPQRVLGAVAPARSTELDEAWTGPTPARVATCDDAPTPALERQGTSPMVPVLAGAGRR